MRMSVWPHHPCAIFMINKQLIFKYHEIEEVPLLN